MTAGQGVYYFVAGKSIVVIIVDLHKIYCYIIYCKYYNKGIIIKLTYWMIFIYKILKYNKS